MRAAFSLQSIAHSSSIDGKGKMLLLLGSSIKHMAEDSWNWEAFGKQRQTICPLSSEKSKYF